MNTSKTTKVYYAIAFAAITLYALILSLMGPMQGSLHGAISGDAIAGVSAGGTQGVGGSGG